VLQLISINWKLAVVMSEETGNHFYSRVLRRIYIEKIIQFLTET